MQGNVVKFLHRTATWVHTVELLSLDPMFNSEGVTKELQAHAHSQALTSSRESMGMRLRLMRTAEQES